jgi:outer membrane protein OmpA-like peptidoglycan-associated protein
VQKSAIEGVATTGGKMRLEYLRPLLYALAWGMSFAPLLVAESDFAENDKPAWAAEATMNPDYKKDDGAQDEAPPPPTGGQATTFYFGDMTSPANPAWAAEAKMNLDYSVSSPAAPAATTTEPAAASVREAAVEACRDALNAEASTCRINFAQGSSNIAPSSHAALKMIAKVAKDCGAVVIEIDGYTDNTGSPAANKTLSEQRTTARGCREAQSCRLWSG